MDSRVSLWLAVAVAALLLLSGCAANPAVSMAGGNRSLPPPDAALDAKAGTEYRLGAQDLLQISVLGVPELNRDVRVNPDGKISLPLIGTVAAGGKTIPELEQEIGALLGKKYLQDPQVSVLVKEYTSQRVTLEGELNKPGIYPLTGKTTLLQAVALGGGLTPLAQTDAVVVFREVKGRKMAAVFDLSKISTGKANDPTVYGDDIVVVAKSGSKDSVHELIQAAPFLYLFFLL